MRKLSACATLILLVAGTVFGQESQVEGDAAKSEVPSFVRPGDVQSEAARLVKSQANRERAWGAYLAGQHKLKELTPALVELIGDPSLGDGWEESIVRQAALDSLIRLNAKVPADALRSLPANYSDEKIILMASEPGANASALLEMFDGGEPAGEAGPDARWLAVGNLLAETKPQGFAAALLRWLRVKAEITIVDTETNIGYGYGSGGGCGGAGGGGPEGFPPVSFYHLSAKALRGAVVVAPGKYPVYYIRTEQIYGGCGYGGLNYIRDFHRIEYLAGLLGTITDELNLDSRPSHTIACKDARQCRSEFVRVRREIEQAYAGVVSALVEKSLLDASDAALLPPHITFRLHDRRQHKTYPLPDKLKGVKMVMEDREARAVPDAEEQ